MFLSQVRMITSAKDRDSATTTQQSDLLYSELQELRTQLTSQISHNQELQIQVQQWQSQAQQQDVDSAGLAQEIATLRQAIQVERDDKQAEIRKREALSAEVEQLKNTIDGIYLLLTAWLTLFTTN